MSERYILDGMKNLVPFANETVINSLNINANSTYISVGQHVQIGSITLIKILNSTETTLSIRNDSGKSVRFVSLTFSENSDGLRAFCNSFGTRSSGPLAKNVKYGDFVLLCLGLGE